MAKYTKAQLKRAFIQAKHYRESVPDLDEQGVQKVDEFGLAMTIDNPETKTAFIKRLQKEWAEEVAVGHIIDRERRIAKSKVMEDSDGVSIE